MKSKLFVSTVVLIITAFSVGGSAVAWFTSQADLLTSTFSAGTLEISDPEYLGLEGDGEDYTVSWSIENTGSKSSYIRARMSYSWDIGSSAEETRVYSAGTDKYFLGYTKGGYTEEAPLVGELRIPEGNQDNPTGALVGYLRAWDDGDFLYVQILTAKVFDSFDQSIIYAGLTTNSSPSDRQWRRQYVHEHSEGEFNVYTLQIEFYSERFNQEPELLFSELVNGDQLYIAVRADLLYLDGVITEPQLGNGCRDSWFAGDDGWWYYGDSTGPFVVSPGGDAELCFDFYWESGIEGSISFDIEAEAVQSSHNAIDTVWPNNPWAD